MSFVFGNGGMGGGSFALVLSGSLEATPGGQPVITGARFPDQAFAPTLAAQLLVAEFAAAWWPKREDKAYALPPPFDPKIKGAEADLLRSQVTAVLNRMPLRGERLGEIIAQADAFDAWWLRLLGGGRAMATLVSAAIQIGQMAGMYWKNAHKFPRPVQVYPAIAPVLATPPHASYPSNHSLQSHLIARSAAEVFKMAGAAAAMPAKFLDEVAGRAAENREVAGVHYPCDSRAGEKLAEKLWPLLMALPGFQAALKKAAEELGALKAGGLPLALAVTKTPAKPKATKKAPKKGGP